MTTTNVKRLAASRETSALVLACILLLGSRTAAIAQSDDTDVNLGLEGAWRVQLTVRDCQTGAPQREFPALFTFAKGGTLTVTTAGQSPAMSTTGLGVWRRTGGHTYTAVSEVFVFSGTGAWTATHRLTRAIEIGDEGDEFTDTVQLEIFSTTGVLLATGCATSAAKRFE
jgi:hypothetical protein